MRGNLFLHWLLYHARVQRAQTQTTEVERQALRRHAAGRRAIVEIGVYEGVSSRLLRETMAPDGTLWCVDPFFPGRLGFSFGLSIARSEVAKSKNGEVHFVTKLSHDAAQGWPEPIDMVFIDADHSYEAVKQDWDDWSPHVVPGGVIALHDSFPVEGKVSAGLGPVRLVRELAETDCGFKVIDRVESVTVFEALASGERTL